MKTFCINLEKLDKVKIQVYLKVLIQLLKVCKFLLRFWAWD